MKTPFIDIHTHNHRSREGVIAVQSLFLQQIDFNSEISNLFSAAVHPWHASQYDSGEVSGMLEKLTSQRKFIAVGETGLDKVCSADYGQQRALFDEQLDFAEAYHKPVIIHAVKSWNDLTISLKRVKVPCILHGYSGGLALTKQLIDLGCYFSMGQSLFRMTPRIPEAIQIIPLTSLFLETDDAKVDIEEIYLKMAKIVNLPLESLKIQIHRNFKTLFSGAADLVPDE